ncbi:MAG TPA: pseudouridine synthase [Clostridia bacterium]
MPGIRLQKYLAMCGTASRRKSEEIIKQGRVSVNGEVITNMGFIVDTSARVEVDGMVQTLEDAKRYIAVNKPEGCITTTNDQFSRKTVMDLVIDIKERIYPVGRLDYNTSGLLLMTNDGDFANAVTHPRNEKEKTYIAKVSGVPSDNDILRLKTGVKVDDYITSPAKVSVLERNGESSVIEITIHEGRNRQVRKMCDAIGHPVISLKRISIGIVSLKGIPEGCWRELSKDEVKSFMKA